MAFTARSDEYLDYSTFGELSDIINKNWTHFSQTFVATVPRLQIRRSVCSIVAEGAIWLRRFGSDLGKAVSTICR